MSGDSERIAAVHFDKQSVEKRNNEIEHERAVAVYDLLSQNKFAPAGHSGEGPYDLHLGVAENRLMLDIRQHKGGKPVTILGLSLTPFRRVMHDYSIVCESYYSAMQNQSLTQVEAIDMGRRAVHNEGAELLIQRLEGKVEIDGDTARRLFTLIYVLHMVGSSSLPSAPMPPRVLFVCTRNAVRSPMAEGLLRRRRIHARVASAGIMGDTIDPMAASVMKELDVDLTGHRGQALNDLSLRDFDIVVALSPEAAAEFDPPPQGLSIESWNIDDPTTVEGNRDTKLEAYRRVRNDLEQRINARFLSQPGKMP